MTFVRGALVGMAALVLGGAAQAAPPFPDAQATDPVALGWMVGSPPPRDRQIRFEDMSFMTFPQTRWSFSHWRELLPSQKMEMHAEHTYSEQLKNLGPITHIRLNLFPDGGVSRIRVLGKVAK